MTGKILIVDDVKTNRLILRKILERDYYTVMEAENGVEAITMAKERHPDLILLDIVMPKLNGIETCKTLKARPETANIPVIMITSADGADERHHGLAAGADDYLSKPFDHDVLFARVRNLLRVKAMLDELLLRGETAEALGITEANLEAFEASRRSILMAPSDARSGEAWRQILADHGGYDIALCLGEEEAFKEAQTGNYDALLVSEELAHGGVGMRLIANLRAHWTNRDLTIIFVAKSGTKAGLRALEFGSNDYMLEPFEPAELVTRLHTQTKRSFLAKNLRDHVNKQLRLSVIDPLTELHNRRYFDDYIPKALKRAEREQYNLALMILDLDHFKSINDTYGHDFGDVVLVEFARRARDNLRAADMIVRFGGEEFVILAPRVSFKEAKTISERLRKLIEIHPFETLKGEQVHVTASIGVSMIEPGEMNIEKILKRADEALYEAKHSGRNRVEFAA